MSRFCTRCGTANDDDAQFCENCGTQCKGKPVSHTALATPPDTPVSDRGAPRNRRKIVIAAFAVAAVLITGAGLAFLLGDETASNEVMSRAVLTYYQQHGAASDNLLCLSNFEYGKDPVAINPYQTEERALLDSLVKGGLYNPPTQIQQGNFFVMTLLRYTHTAMGTKALKNNRLCLASTLKLTAIRFDPVQDMPQGKFTRVYFRYAPADPAPWLQGELAEKLTAYLSPDRERVLTMALVNRKWVVSDANSAGSNTSAARLGAKQAALDTSILNRFMQIFAPSNPLLGNWRASEVPVFGDVRDNHAGQLSFNAHEATINGRSFPISYKIKDSTVTVMLEGIPAPLVFKVTDQDHVVLAKSEGRVNFERVKN